MEELMFVIASVTIGFALVSNQFERSLITPPRNSSNADYLK